jgi:hypothetical protein
MSQIGSTEALEKYLKLEQDKKQLLEENIVYREEIEKLRKSISETGNKIDVLWHWLESRENTKTETIKRKMAITFKWAYMEAEFADLRAKWPNKEARDWAEKRYPSFVDESTDKVKE